MAAMAQFLLKLDEEDASLLARAAEADKLTRTEVLRRALRLYAKELGVKSPAKRRAK
jgi:hypothetical protein